MGTQISPVPEISDHPRARATYNVQRVQRNLDRQPSVMSNGYRVAIVGATGVVGEMIRRVLEERADRFPVSELVLFASERSVGKRIKFRDEELHCSALEQDAIKGFDLVFSSAGGDVSKKWAPLFAEQGAFVIDKSSAFRKEPHPLVVPEVNPDALTNAIQKGQRIIASPNCSTTQLVMALKPLHDAHRIVRLTVTTYQAVSGTGKRAVEELERETKQWARDENVDVGDVYPHQIAFNVLGQAGSFLPDGRTDEEEKLVAETTRILDDSSIRISAACARVPVMTCHSESVIVEFAEAVKPDRARSLLRAFDGVSVVDEPRDQAYPTAVDAADEDDVFVGRIRQDSGHDNALAMWIVGDNLRKGAATNAVQIAEFLHDNGHLGQQYARQPEALHA